MRAALPLPHKSPARRRVGGFTLVEMLVVIIIIGLLTSLLVVAIGKAMITARDARVIAEIAQLDAAVKAYKEKYGSIPSTKWAGNPATQNAAFMANLRRAFPRAGFTDYDSFRNGLLTATAALSSPGYPGGGLDANTIDPREALVLWLGGLPAQHDATGTTWGGSSKLDGFSKNPAAPFAPRMTAGDQRTAPLFEFDQSRLGDQDGDGWLEYYPPGVNLAYVYFDAGSYVRGPVIGDATSGFARPYTDSSITSVSVSFKNPNSFQIISGGQDDNYGANHANKAFPAGLNYGSEDNDNLTNFATNRLEESLP